MEFFFSIKQTRISCANRRKGYIFMKSMLFNQFGYALQSFVIQINLRCVTKKLYGLSLSTNHRASISDFNSNFSPPFNM